MTNALDSVIKLLEDFSISAWIIDEEKNIVYMNHLMQDHFGNLAGNKTSIVYDHSTYENEEKSISEEGSEEVIISEVPYRRISSKVDFAEEGSYQVELFEDISEQKFTQAKMAQALAKISAETKMAKTIQNGILPIDDTYWNTIAYSSMYMPADDLGGDFYDVIKLSDDEYLLYIADVSGHGIQASLLTIFMRERVRANVEAALEGTGILLSKLVHEFNALEIDSMVYITMAVCKYIKSKGELSVSNAGHNCCPLVIRNNRRVEMIPIRGMPVCALAGDYDYDEEIISINPGDRIILYTDGIIEEVDSAKGRALGADGVRGLAEKYHEYNGSYVAHIIMEESSKYSLIGAKDDRSIIVADILS